jgi:hypothetical protein
MFGDWGTHVIDLVHDHLTLGLATRTTPLALTDYIRIKHYHFESFAYACMGEGTTESCFSVSGLLKQFPSPKM